MVSRASWEKLQYTITEGTNANTVRVLLESRYPLLLSDLTEDQETTLQGATQKATPAVVELFVCACAQGNLGWVKHLLPECGLDCVSDLRRAPIAAAAGGGHIEVVEYLLRYGDGSPLTEETCLKPLLAAIDHGHVDVLEFLLNHTEVGVVFDRLYRMLLFHAVRGDDIAIASLLLAHGAEANSRIEQGTSMGMTLLSIARSEKMARLLVREGVEMFQDTFLREEVFRCVAEY